MQPSLQMREVWTVEDVRALDVEDWRRYEIVDGSLVVSPSASRDHERVSSYIREFLWRAKPDGLIVVGPVGVALGRSYRIPDLVVTRESLLRGPDALAPADVMLAVEVVSPGSITTDRVTKPAQYAAAGIAHYWRVETDPVSLTVYSLTDGETTYSEIGTWFADDVAGLEQPFPVEIELGRLA